MPDADPYAPRRDTDALRRAAEELTLLDYMACAALSAILTVERGMADLHSPVSAALVARKAYRVAEAMIVERAEQAQRYPRA